MSIRLLDYRAVRVHFIPSQALLEYFDEMQEEQAALPSIYYNSIFPETEDEDENDFLVHFKLDIKAPLPEGKEDDGILKVDFIARFSSKNPITQEFKDSNFPKVNAPAIAYPFIRAFVNNFFINSGYDPVLLPTYNFTKSVQEVAK
ncbi:hypothetical protein F4V57_07600 [Acinetobacter qingfengensis]|uniref:Preprotein translocase subunit SecB n=1 Tax=Acinetobacter qingfengensis TaxID=1262585 RepID=A0A1E7RA75_9GAMM|nr:protein-export chaperone SecB [Acinetobacter qingfengensis]KAA8733905.1 hypothetical protein F4V57_07600 [Acinetobacter qingfengensis]OEY96175.1 hypothetical protein BJI46_12415 [Acinetobacter qingfengensis]